MGHAPSPIRGPGEAANGLTAAAHRGIGGASANRGTTMEAIYAILIFVAAMFALNRLEFGRFD
jgi:hypothetical protein